MPVIILSIIVVIMSAALIYLSVRLALFKNAARRIAERLDFVLKDETNIGIDFEVNEKSLARLITSLNKDIDKLKKLKSEYRKKDIELRESISSISHDLRTPLTVIASYTNLIERGNANLDEKTRAGLEIIKTRVGAMNTLIEELFNYSLYESEQFSLDLADVCINDSLENCLTEFYNIITERGITPQINICAEKVVRSLNTKALDRIFGNILSNAVKYSDGDLSVTLNSGGEIIFANTTHSLDTVSVGKLFNRFFTVESAGASTGLGLSIAKILTERMNGTINAELIDSKIHIRVKF